MNLLLIYGLLPVSSEININMKMRDY